METEAVSNSASAESDIKEAFKTTPTDDTSSSTYTHNGHDTKLLDSDNKPNSSTLESNNSHLKGEDQNTDTDGSLTIDLTSPPPLTPPAREPDAALNSNGVGDDNIDDQNPSQLDPETAESASQETSADNKQVESMDVDPPSGVDQNLPPDEKPDDHQIMSSAPPALVDTQALEQPPKESDNSCSQSPQDYPAGDDTKLTESDDFHDQREESPKLVIDTGFSNPVADERERAPISTIKTNESSTKKTPQETSERKPAPHLQSSSSSDEMEIRLDIPDNELSDDSASEEDDEPHRRIPTCISNTDHLKASNLHSTIQSNSSTSSSYTTTAQGQRDLTSANNFKPTPHPHSNATPLTHTPNSSNTVTTIVDAPNNKHGSPSPAMMRFTSSSSHRGDSPPQSGSPSHQGSGGGGGGDNGGRTQKDMSPSHRIRQVAKVKQFFSTLQKFGNDKGSEVAEQVQELISAVVNETVTIEEFHQEVQTVTNYPLKDFIIPFLRDNLGYLRAELKESSHALSDILGDNTPIPNTIGLTPQLADDDLPVLPSSNKPNAPLRVVSSSVISHAQSSNNSSGNSSSGSNAKTSKQVNHGTSSSTSLHTNYHQTTPPSHMHTSHSLSAGGHMDMDSGFDGSPSLYTNGANHGLSRKRLRGPPIDRQALSSEKEIQTISSDKSHSSYLPKRPRHDDSESTIITSNPRERHITTLPPSYPQPPPTHPLTTTPTSAPQALGEVGGYATPLSSGGSIKLKALNEDCGHVQMMLNSVQGMVERTRQAMVALKERINVTNLEMERQELDIDNIVQQHVKEALEKARKQATEEKNRLLMDASKQLRDTVASVKSEMENRMAQAQTFAVQEALKEANQQSNSKENCWNCGRRATETCSGCNKARYCGTFCQHKDWANHMHHCASGLHAQGSSTDDHYTERQHHSQTIAAADQAIKAAKLPQGITPIPVNVVTGNELGLRVVPGRIPHSHTDIAVTIKTEKT